MIELKVNGQTKHAFLLQKGDENLIVIMLEHLARPDYLRLLEAEKKGGPDMMRAMRDTMASNGVNLLNLYKDLITVIPTHQPKKPEVPTEERKITILEEDAPVKKKRGRPRKS